MSFPSKTGVHVYIAVHPIGQPARSNRYELLMQERITLGVVQHQQNHQTVTVTLLHPLAQRHCPWREIDLLLYDCTDNRPV